MFTVSNQLCKIELTAERLREVLDYDKISGLFTWKYPINNRIKVGDIAGYIAQGYWRISVDGKTYLGHRLAWLYVTGEWPVLHIDHEDTNRSNNAFKNLREATVAQNHFNIGITASNTSGFKGVSWFNRTRKWRARITIEGCNKTIGYFETKEAAHKAYCQAAVKHYGEFANFGLRPTAQDETRIE
jgi:hypothetical protein